MAGRFLSTAQGLHALMQNVGGVLDVLKMCWYLRLHKIQVECDVKMLVEELIALNSPQDSRLC